MSSRHAWLLLALFAALGCDDDSSNGDHNPRDAGELAKPPRVDAGPVREAPEIELTAEELRLPAALDRPAALAFIPGSDDELLILEQRRRVAHYRIADDAAELIGSFEAPEVFSGRDCGLIALTFDPDFADNGLLYIAMCLSQQSSGVFRFVFDPSDYAGTAASMTEIFVATEAAAEYGIHNVGSLGFDAEGNMWVLFGDKTRSANARDTSNVLGGVARIVPNRDAGGAGHEPADGNPYAETPALFAHGLRSPWRGVMDRFGRLWVGDVGAGSWEEINLIAPGGYHGWPHSEGPCDGCAGSVDPVAAWEGEDDDPYILDDLDAAATTRRVAWLAGFYEPRTAGADPYNGALDNRLLFGDMCSGFLRVLEVDGDGQVVHDVHAGHLRFMTGVDQGPDGHYYVTTYGSCGAGKGTHPAGRLVRLVCSTPERCKPGRERWPPDR